ncbi:MULTISPECIES: exodeoxyribonuclease VII small subunit [Pseudofrankia]|uniref:exodeoxyribonuclease VII small subunit n=1 Tax=Pseudofrankia TaxID=2994363 RepID=UPI000234BF0F|nr:MULTISPECIES: exodeoxyribonuclease VII small subunit [Pseudofrankia]OHV37859.1 exodeoxyribonuclease VII small subunit [Pseudofrankia sp. EUN1h]
MTEPSTEQAAARPGRPAGGGPTFEDSRAELEDVVRRLEAGGVTLEESLSLWERGEELARTCQALLDGARARIAAAEPQPGPGRPSP